MLFDGQQGYSQENRGWVTIIPDAFLIQRVMELVCRTDIAGTANLIRAYETSVDGYNATGEREYLEDACESEYGLRVVLGNHP